MTTSPTILKGPLGQGPHLTHLWASSPGKPAHCWGNTQTMNETDCKKHEAIVIQHLKVNNQMWSWLFRASKPPLAFRIKASLLAWHVRPSTGTAHRPSPVQDLCTQTARGGCRPGLSNQRDLDALGYDLGQVIFSLWTSFLIYKIGIGRKLEIDNSAYLLQMLWWLNGNYIGDALSTEPGVASA